jgi:hypothetical protein
VQQHGRANSYRPTLHCRNHGLAEDGELPEKTQRRRTFQGLSRKAVRKKIQDVVARAEVGTFTT